MPCNDGGPPANLDLIYEERLRHNSPTADALCELCQYLEATGTNFSDASPKAFAWWKEHKERDRKRMFEEAKKLRTAEDLKQLLDRLTPYEKSLLKDHF